MDHGRKVLLQAAAWAVVSGIAFAASSAAGKLAGVRLPPAEVSLFRAFVAPLDFLGIPIAAVIGWSIFGDVPSAYDLVGAVLIIGSAWYVIRTGAPRG